MVSAILADLACLTAGSLGVGLAVGGDVACTIAEKDCGALGNLDVLNKSGIDTTRDEYCRSW